MSVIWHGLHAEVPHQVDRATAASEGQYGSHQWSSPCCAPSPFQRAAGNPEVPCSDKAVEAETLCRGQVRTTSLGTALPARD